MRDGSERRIRGSELRDLIELLNAIDTQARILRRRSMALEELVTRHRDPQEGLPIVRTLVYRPGEPEPVEYYHYSEEQFNELRRAEHAKYGDVEVVDASLTLSGGGESESQAGTHRIVRQELSECKALEQLLRRMEAHKLTVGDYFATRAENVAGERPPARFLLDNGGDEPVDLDNLAQVVTAVRDIGSRSVEIKRYKGLGEMNAEELWETTMDPARRALLKVVISDDADDPEQFELDVREADRVFSILMGDNVEARREFIKSNAANVKNLDI